MNVMLQDGLQQGGRFECAGTSVVCEEELSDLVRLAAGAIIIKVDGLSDIQRKRLLRVQRTSADCLLAMTASTDHETWHQLFESGVDGVVPPSADHALIECCVASVRVHKKRSHQLRQRVAQLEQKLEDRIVIERAKGIIAARAQIGEEEAMRRLRREARNQRRSMRDIAQTVLDAEQMLKSADTLATK